MDPKKTSTITLKRVGDLAQDLYRIEEIFIPAGGKPLADARVGDRIGQVELARFADRHNVKVVR